MATRKRMHVLELTQKPDDRDALEHWVREVRKLKQRLESEFAVRITDEDLRASIRTANRERAGRRALAELMRTDDPPLTGRELLDFKAILAAIPADLEQYEKAARSLPGRRISPPAGDRVRVLLTGVPLPHGAERVIDILEDSGGLVVCQENCTGIKPIIEDVAEDTNDPLRAIAEKYFHLPCSVMTPNNARMDLLRRLAAEYRPRCVVELTWQACLTYDVESRRVREFVEDELSLPYLKIETDYSPSDTERIRMRVEALYETVRN